MIKLAETMSNLDVDVEDVDVAFKGVERVHACRTNYLVCLLAYNQPTESLQACFKNDSARKDMILQTLRFMGSVGLAPAPTEVNDLLAEARKEVRDWRGENGMDSAADFTSHNSYFCFRNSLDQGARLRVAAIKKSSRFACRVVSRWMTRHRDGPNIFEKHVLPFIAAFSFGNDEVGSS